MGLFDKVRKKSKTAGKLNWKTFIGSGATFADAVNNTATSILNEGISYYAQKLENSKTFQRINKGLAVIDQVGQANYWAALQLAVNGETFAKNTGAFSPKATQYLRSTLPQPLHANLRLEEVEQLVNLSHAIAHARKNLWLIEISDYQADSRNSGPGGGMRANFNLLAHSLSYTPFNIESEQYRIGSAIADGVKSSSKAEISLTTLDDEQGMIKRWYKQKASHLIHSDGTVGVLSDCLIKIRILHAFVSDSTNNGGFEESIICRPVGTEYELSRADNAMQEFTLRFEQVDTFMM